MRYLTQYMFHQHAANPDVRWETDYVNYHNTDEQALAAFQMYLPSVSFQYRLVRHDNDHETDYAAPGAVLTYLATKCSSAATTSLSDEILHRGCTMPALVPAPILQSQIDPNERMVHVAVQRHAATGSKLYLHINATKLHETLAALGVPKVGNRFENRPTSRTAIADASFNLSTEVFLVAEYPAKFDLSQVFTAPPSLSNLKRLCNSSFDAVRRILEHYQPIDISVEIQKKAVR
jgi:hypothetical protein